MKLFFLFILFTAAISQAQNYGGGGSNNSCSVGERKVRCRDMSTNPSTDKELEINSCSVSCNEKNQPICLPGYLTGTHCDEPIEPSRCYCGS
jgi:hypothetical protein